jgi:hypothetical protein
MKMGNKLTWVRMIMYVCVLTMAVSACDDDDDDDSNVQPVSINDVNNTNTNNTAMAFSEVMSGNREVPVVSTSGVGSFVGTFDPTTNMISYTVTWTLGNPNDLVTGMHFHGPADTTQSAPILIGVSGFPTASSGSFTGVTPILNAQQEADLRAGKLYFNVHSTTYPAGELRGNLK